MIPTIKSDQASRPWIKFWGDWLYRVDVPKRTRALPLGDVGSVYHVHRFDMKGKLLLSPCVRLLGLFVIVLDLRSIFPVLGI